MSYLNCWLTLLIPIEVSTQKRGSILAKVCGNMAACCSKNSMHSRLAQALQYLYLCSMYIVLIIMNVNIANAFLDGQGWGPSALFFNTQLLITDYHCTDQQTMLHRSQLMHSVQRAQWRWFASSGVLDAKEFILIFLHGPKKLKRCKKDPKFTKFFIK